MDAPPSTRPGRASPARRRALAAAGVLLGLYAAGRFATSLPAVERALGARVERALREQLGADVTVGSGVEVDWAFRASFGPLEVRAPRPSPRPVAAGSPAEPVLRVERVKVRASALALLAGRLEPASIRLLGVRVVPGRRAAGLRALVALVDRQRARPRASVPDGAGAPRAPRAPDAGGAPQSVPRVHARGLVLALDVAGRAIEVGPMDADLTASLTPAAERGDLAIRLAGGARGAASLEAREGTVRLRARLVGLGPEDLPPALRELPARLEAGRLALEVEAEAPRALDRAEGRVTLRADGLFLSGERVAAAPLGPLDTEVTGTLRWDGAERRLSLSGGTVAVARGTLRVAASGEARLAASLPFSLALAAERVDHAALIAALPPALAPPPAAPRPEGTFDARLAVAGPAFAPAAWSLDASLDLGRMREASRRLRPQPLREPFLHRPAVADGAPGLSGAGFQVGPSNPDFVPLAELPAHVVRAVTASEDAGFFAHHGFDFAELGLAFAAGAEQGRVVRGGSTITQQLAKNLYVGGEKTLARKVREAAITLALEACLPKARLLEIYLNVAEWGPGLHGIGPAARHWFGKDARALGPREAAFLATVIPNPVRYGYMRRRGLSPAWTERVDELLRKMAEQGVLTDDQLVQALREPLVFVEG